MAACGKVFPSAVKSGRRIPVEHKGFMKVIPFKGVNTLLMSRPRHWNVISVCREDTLPMTRFCLRHIHVNCDDVDDTGLRELSARAHVAGKIVVPPNDGHIVQALRFARRWGTDDLLLHCLKGLSRSTAIAWCILFDQLKQEDQAWAELYRIRPPALPNPRIIRIGRQIIPQLPASFFENSEPP